MSPNTRISPELLRRYLLDTLSPRKRRQVERHLDASAEWRAALDVERQNLSMLDALEPVAPSRDLAAAVANRRAEVAKTRTWRAVALYMGAPAAVVVALIIILPVLGRAREAALRPSTQNTLKQWGIVLAMYAHESHGAFPPLSRYEGCWVPDLETLYPEYLADWNLLLNENTPDKKRQERELARIFAEDPIDWRRVSEIAAENFTYTGYALKNAEEAAAVRERRWQVAEAPSSDGPFPLKVGVERFFITDINNPSGSQMPQSTIPIMFENLQLAEYSRPDGANVLYMDGHVEFLRFGERFPVTQAAADAFAPPQEE